MSKFYTRHKSKQVLGITEQRMSDLANWIFNEFEDAMMFRRQFDKVVKECLRMYEGVPKLEVRDTPVENAPNIEVTIGAISADTIYAQALDLIFNISPLVTVRSKPKMKGDTQAAATAKAFQRFVDHIATSTEFGLRPAIETAVLEDVKLGTGQIYIPWVEKIKKTKSAKVLSSGPHFYAMPIEDVIVPAGSYSSIEDLPIMGLRFYYTMNDINMMARKGNWQVDGIQPIFKKSDIRQVRESLGKVSEPANQRMQYYDIMRVYCNFDIDSDGIDEELLVIWNHSGRKILYVGFPQEDRKPLEKMVYQLREHMYYGLGVLQMLMPYEEKISDVHNYATLNVLLANSRMWVGSENLSETMKIWPGKYVQTANPREDLQALQMADVYSSIWQDQMVTMQLANQRVGINDVSRGSSIPSRTPGITAMSFIQQVSRRFVPAFDSMRLCISNAIAQAVYRYQERIMSGDVNAEAGILQILGYEDGLLVLAALRSETFDEQVDIELTASSSTVNREAERQNAIMLTNILAQYYQRTLELITIASNPQTPPEVVSVARKIIESAGEVIDRTMRTFDQVRDPSLFLIEVEDEMNKIEVDTQQQQGLQQLMGMLGGAMAGSGGSEPLALPFGQ
jgi:hypothetical protein